MRVRLRWAALPAHIAVQVTDRIGPVIGATSHEGGSSPGMVATLRTATEHRSFVKAVSASFHQRRAELYLDEARVNELLPPGTPAPAMQWWWTDGDWVVLAFESADAAVAIRCSVRAWTSPTC